MAKQQNLQQKQGKLKSKFLANIIRSLSQNYFLWPEIINLVDLCHNSNLWELALIRLAKTIGHKLVKCNWSQRQTP